MAEEKNKDKNKKPEKEEPEQTDDIELGTVGSGVDLDKTGSGSGLVNFELDPAESRFGGTAFAEVLEDLDQTESTEKQAPEAELDKCLGSKTGPAPVEITMPGTPERVIVKELKTAPSIPFIAEITLLIALAAAALVTIIMILDKIPEIVTTAQIQNYIWYIVGGLGVVVVVCWTGPPIITFIRNKPKKKKVARKSQKKEKR